MIAIHVPRSGVPLTPDAAGCLATALAEGTSLAPSLWSGEGVTCAEVRPRAISCCALHKSWHPAENGRGHQVLLRGHLTNKRDLAVQLGISPETGDAEVYAAGYGQWGDQIDLRAQGAYAVILYVPAQQYLRLLRSPWDAPPLHVCLTRHFWAAASTPRAFAAAGLTELDLDDQKLADSLFWNYSEPDRSWFAGVSRVSVGERWDIMPGRVDRTAYYDLQSLRPVRYSRDEEYVEAADALLEKALHTAMDGFERPALSLRDDLESEALSRYGLRVAGGRRLCGFTGAIEPTADGARRSSGRAVQAPGMGHVQPGRMPAMDLENLRGAKLLLAHHQESVLCLSGCVPNNLRAFSREQEVQTRAARAGCDVVLQGDWAQASLSFSGQGAFPHWLRQGQVGRLTHELRAFGHRDGSSLQAFWRRVAKPYVMQGTSPLRLWGSELGGRWPSWSPINPAFGRSMHVRERALHQGCIDPSWSLSTAAMRRRMVSEGANEAADILQGLEMLSGVPIRRPLLWRPLQEFCFGLPDDQYVRHGVEQYLLQRLIQRHRTAEEATAAQSQGGKPLSCHIVDWHRRLKRQRQSLLRELDRFASDPVVAERIDVPRLRRTLETMPVNQAHVTAKQRRVLLGALPRALGTARFIQRVGCSR